MQKMYNNCPKINRSIKIQIMNMIKIENTLKILVATNKDGKIKFLILEIKMIYNQLQMKITKEVVKEKINAII